MTKSGEIRYLLVNATTRRDANNSIVGVVGVAQDVTEAFKHDHAVAVMANGKQVCYVKDCNDIGSFIFPDVFSNYS